MSRARRVPVPLETIEYVFETIEDMRELTDRTAELIGIELTGSDDAQRLADLLQSIVSILEIEGICYRRILKQCGTGTGTEKTRSLERVG